MCSSERPYSHPPQRTATASAPRCPAQSPCDTCILAVYPRPSSQSRPLQLNSPLRVFAAPHLFPCPAKRLPGPPPKPPDVCSSPAASDFPASTAPSSGQSPRQVPRCLHYFRALAMGSPLHSGFGAPSAGLQPFPSRVRAWGDPSSRGQLWAPGPKMRSRCAAGLPGPWGAGSFGEARGWPGRSRCGLGGRGYSRLRTDGAGGGEV